MTDHSEHVSPTKTEKPKGEKPEKSTDLPKTGWGAFISIAGILGKAFPYFLLLVLFGIFMYFLVEILSENQQKVLEASNQARQSVISEYEVTTKILQETYKTSGDLHTRMVENIEKLINLQNSLQEENRKYQVELREGRLEIDAARNNLIRAQNKVEEQKTLVNQLKADLSKTEAQLNGALSQTNAALQDAEKALSEKNKAENEKAIILSSLKSLENDVARKRDELKILEISVSQKKDVQYSDVERIEKLKSELMSLADLIMKSDAPNKLRVEANNILTKFSSDVAKILSDFISDPDTYSGDLVTKLRGTKESDLVEYIRNSHYSFWFKSNLRSLPWRSRPPGIPQHKGDPELPNETVYVTAVSFDDNVLRNVLSFVFVDGNFSRVFHSKNSYSVIAHDEENLLQPTTHYFHELSGLVSESGVEKTWTPEIVWGEGDTVVLKGPLPTLKAYIFDELEEGELNNLEEAGDSYWLLERFHALKNFDPNNVFTEDWLTDNLELRNTIIVLFQSIIRRDLKGFKGLVANEVTDGSLGRLGAWLLDSSSRLTIAAAKDVEKDLNDADIAQFHKFLEGAVIFKGTHIGRYSKEVSVFFLVFSQDESKNQWKLVWNSFK